MSINSTNQLALVPVHNTNIVVAFSPQQAALESSMNAQKLDAAFFRRYWQSPRCILQRHLEDKAVVRKGVVPLTAICQAESESKTRSETDPVKRMGPDPMGNVLSFLTGEDLGRCASVSKNWQKQSSEYLGWEVVTKATFWRSGRKIKKIAPRSLLEKNIPNSSQIRHIRKTRDIRPQESTNQTGTWY
jgi:hypothetical protein